MRQCPTSQAVAAPEAGCALVPQGHLNPLRSAGYLLIEINPWHQRFYQQLGFAAQASERHCARAGAAAVLMAAPASALLHVLADQPLAHAA